MCQHRHSMHTATPPLSPHPGVWIPHSQSRRAQAHQGLEIVRLFKQSIRPPLERTSKQQVKSDVFKQLTVHSRSPRGTDPSAFHRCSVAYPFRWWREMAHNEWPKSEYRWVIGCTKDTLTMTKEHNSPMQISNLPSPLQLMRTAWMNGRSVTTGDADASFPAFTSPSRQLKHRRLLFPGAVIDQDRPAHLSSFTVMDQR